VLKKKQQLTDPPNVTKTTDSNQPPKAEVITIDDDDTEFSSQSTNQMDCSPTADISIVSDTRGNAEKSGAANIAPSGGSHVAQITLGMLSTALQNVNQSLGVASASDKTLTEVTVVSNSQSDKDTIVGLPGEKKPRLEACDTATSTLPQDIHDKLHSNIK